MAEPFLNRGRPAPGVWTLPCHQHQSRASPCGAGEDFPDVHLTLQIRQFTDSRGAPHVSSSWKLLGWAAAAPSFPSVRESAPSLPLQKELATSPPWGPGFLPSGSPHFLLTCPAAGSSAFLTEQLRTREPRGHHCVGVTLGGLRRAALGVSAGVIQSCVLFS